MTPEPVSGLIMTEEKNLNRTQHPKIERIPIAERQINHDLLPVLTVHEKSLHMNNRAEAAGVLVEDLTLSHEMKGEKYYAGRLRTQVQEPRDDGTARTLTADVLFIVSEDLLVGKSIRAGDLVQISGRRAHRNEPKPGGGIHQRQFVFAKHIRVLDAMEGSVPNHIVLDGYLCKGGDRKDPYRIFARRTDSGITMCDLHLAINRPAGVRIVDGQERLRVKTDHVVCVVKGELAHEAAKLQVGDRLRVEGYMTNRYFTAKVRDENGNPVSGEDGEPCTEMRECHEVVLTQITLIDEQVEREAGDRAAAGGHIDE